jgi:Domain of unknown function (DUF4352)
MLAKYSNGIPAATLCCKMLPMTRTGVGWKRIVFGLLAVGLVAALSVTILRDEDQAQTGEEASAVGVEEPVVLHGVRYSVTRIQKAKRLYAQLQPSEYDEPKQALGVYVAVHLTVENIGDEAASGSIHDSTFVGGDGKTYALGSLSNGTTIFELQPDVSDRARLVFDVDPAAVRAGNLGLANCPLVDRPEPSQGCATARIALGLQ